MDSKSKTKESTQKTKEQTSFQNRPKEKNQQKVVTTKETESVKSKSQPSNKYSKQKVNKEQPSTQLNKKQSKTKNVVEVTKTEKELEQVDNIKNKQVIKPESNEQSLYNTSLTKNSFSGKYKNLFSKEIVDDDGKILGTLSSKNIKDLNNNVIATLQDTEKIINEDGKAIIIKKYSSVTNKDSFTIDKGSVNKNNKRIAKLSLPSMFDIRIYSIIIAVLLLSIIGLTIAYFTVPFKIKPIIDIRDINGSWETQKELMVFNSRLQPGVSGEYSFIIRNPHDIEVEYTVEFTKNLENVDIDYFPILFMLQSENKTQDNYINIDNFKINNLVLKPNSEEEFCLKWQWPFDNENNEEDTIIALNNGKISIKINMSAKAK